MQFLILLALPAVMAAKNFGIDKDPEAVLGASEVRSPVVSHTNQIITSTAFDEGEDTVVEAVPYETEYVEDSDLEYGKEELRQEGVPGVLTKHYKVISWLGEEIDRTLLDQALEPPVTEVIAEGTKIVWRLHETPDMGRVKYWYKMTVWATKYDGNCIGCSGRTYSGTPVRKGVCAVDPNVIPLGTNFYVEGYGVCRAEDIGGAIKGEKIDLGYEKASEANWGAGWKTIYLLTSAPE